MNACRHIDKLPDSAKWAGQRGREEKGKGEGGIDCDTATVIYAERQDESEER